MQWNSKISRNCRKFAGKLGNLNQFQGFFRSKKNPGFFHDFQEFQDMWPPCIFFQYAEMNSCLLQKLLHFYQLNYQVKKNSSLSNPIRYPEYLYWSISGCFVNLTAPNKQFSSVGYAYIKIFIYLINNVNIYYFSMIKWNWNYLDLNNFL